MNEHYLIHYGVKGMKWGVRHDREPTGERQRGLSEKQKKVIKSGAIATGMVLAAYGGYKLYSSNIGKRIIQQTNGFTGIAMPDSFINDMKADFGKINASVDRMERFVNANPYYDTHVGGKENCVSCALNLVLNHMGFDCKVRPNIDIDPVSGLVTKGSKYLEDLRDAIDGSQFEERYYNNINEVVKKLSSYGDGACGIIGTTQIDQHGQQTRHAIAWFNGEGMTAFQDSQQANSILNHLMSTRGVDYDTAKKMVYSTLGNIDPNNLGKTTKLGKNNSVQILRLDTATRIAKPEYLKTLIW